MGKRPRLALSLEEVMREYDDYHRYGLVKIGPTQYEKCTDKCCKSGGPAFGKEEDES